MNFVSNLANHSEQTRLGAELGIALGGKKLGLRLGGIALGNELDSKLESFELGVPLESRLGTEMNTLIGERISW